MIRERFFISLLFLVGALTFELELTPSISYLGTVADSPDVYIVHGDTTFTLKGSEAFCKKHGRWAKVNFSQNDHLTEGKTKKQVEIEVCKRGGATLIPHFDATKSESFLIRHSKDFSKAFMFHKLEMPSPIIDIKLENSFANADNGLFSGEVVRFQFFSNAKFHIPPTIALKYANAENESQKTNLQTSLTMVNDKSFTYAAEFVIPHVARETKLELFLGDWNDPVFKEMIYPLTFSKSASKFLNKRGVHVYAKINGIRKNNLELQEDNDSFSYIFSGSLFKNIERDNPVFQIVIASRLGLTTQNFYIETSHDIKKYKQYLFPGDVIDITLRPNSDPDTAVYMKFGNGIEEMQYNTDKMSSKFYIPWINEKTNLQVYTGDLTQFAKQYTVFPLSKTTYLIK
ncbi:hypothetical protein O9G_005898 [Rozella allomycis CSF55]|uniref:Uncharacterized protein n=1 Tax=Rozella allomycis (strain CSF55) TaxID=988480 RepID=A0A075APW7_ROZAC|nr:hypothetical protein O9G_005898 [Rozella allomycis CSF55]|eukprot:EPZ30780.1 hypothetical protein O9G_005898 [Rozella allomycis CSF55]